METFTTTTDGMIYEEKNWIAAFQQEMLRAAAGFDYIKREDKVEGAYVPLDGFDPWNGLGEPPAPIALMMWYGDVFASARLFEIVLAEVAPGEYDKAKKIQDEWRVYQAESFTDTWNMLNNLKTAEDIINPEDE